MKIDILQVDITGLKVDAIVNAANNNLHGGGGVDGAIHRAAGEQLLEECRTLKGCKTGSAKITKAYNLPCDYVIHTVGPVWTGGRKQEDELLASCYHQCMRLADEYHVKSLAFPAISCGVYRFPILRASDIAISTIKNSTEYTNVENVIFSCFDHKIETALLDSLAKYGVPDQ